VPVRATDADAANAGPLTDVDALSDDDVDAMLQQMLEQRNDKS
jgi:hypothetical protein